MAGAFPDNFSKESPFSTASSPVVGAPPPPPEVKVRTMRSDLASMEKTGGGLPRFESVAVAGLSLGKEPAAAAAGARGGTGKKNEFLTASLIVLALFLVGGGLYVAYIAFFEHAGTPASAPPAAAPSPTPTPGAGAPGVGVVFTHVSLFKEVPDQTLTITFPAAGGVQSAADLQSYSQKMLSILAAAKPSAGVIELHAQFSDGRDLSASDLLSQAGAQVLDPQFLSANFNPDATFFVYQDKGGFWPGYIIALKPGGNWLFLTGGLQKIESSTASIGNMFLTNPGAPSANGFADGTISGAAVRILPFGAPGVSFVYGEFGNYLIMSTSPSGFAAAVSRMQ